MAELSQPTLLSPSGPRSGKALGIAIADLPVALAASLQVLDEDNDGFISPHEVARAVALLQQARKTKRRLFGGLAIGTLLVTVCVATTAVLAGSSSAFIMQRTMGYHVDSNAVMYSHSGRAAGDATPALHLHSVATSSAIHATELGALPGLKASGYDYNLISSVTLDNVPPHGYTLGFPVTGFIWYNASAMDLFLGQSYTCSIRDGHWSLHKPYALGDAGDAGDASEGRRHLSMKEKLEGAWRDGASDIEGASSAVKSAVTTIDTVGRTGASFLANEMDSSKGSGRICGNFCGPGWCAGQSISEDDCDAYGSSPEAGSCADACCQMHDNCCKEGFAGNTPLYKSCNDKIVSCLSGCSGKSQCTAADGNPFPVSVIKEAMHLVSNQCCGSACPSS